MLRTEFPSHSPHSQNVRNLFQIFSFIQLMLFFKFSFLIKRILEVVIGLQVIFGLFQQWIIPSVKNSLETFSVRSLCRIWFIFSFRKVISLTEQPENGGAGSIRTSSQIGCAESFALVNLLLFDVPFILEYHGRDFEIRWSQFLRRLVERNQSRRFLASVELAYSPLGCQVSSLKR